MKWQCGKVHQREKCDALSPGACRAKAEFCRPKLLGAWIFCNDGRPRLDGDS